MVAFSMTWNRVVSVRNSHRIRLSRNENVPYGRHVVLYSMSGVFASRTYMRVMDQRDVDICRTECIFRGECTIAELLEVERIVSL